VKGKRSSLVAQLQRPTLLLTPVWGELHCGQVVSTLPLPEDRSFDTALGGGELRCYEAAAKTRRFCARGF